MSEVFVDPTPQEHSMTFAQSVVARQEQLAQELGLNLSTFILHADEDLDVLVYLDWLE